MTVIAEGSTGFIITVLVVYFVPTFVAIYRHHHNTAAIIVVDVFLGWTFLGWVVALAMAFTAVKQPA